MHAGGLHTPVAHCASCTSGIVAALLERNAILSLIDAVRVNQGCLCVAVCRVGSTLHGCLRVVALAGFLRVSCSGLHAFSFHREHLHGCPACRCGRVCCVGLVLGGVSTTHCGTACCRNNARPVPTTYNACAHPQHIGRWTLQQV